MLRHCLPAHLRILFAPAPAAVEGGGTPPAPTPAPVTPPATPPVEPPAAPAPTAVEEDPLMATILADLKSATDDEPPVEIIEAPAEPVAPPAAPVVPAAPIAPAVTPQATPPAAAPTPTKKKAFKSVIRKPEDASLIDGPPVPAAPAVSATPPIIPPVQPTDDEQYIQTLTPEQKDELLEAEVAERLFPERKGHRAKLLQFYKNFDQKVVELKQRHGDNLDSNAPEIQALVESRPKLAIHETKKVSRHIGAEEATAATKKEMGPKLTKLEIDQRRIELAPKFEKFAVTTFTDGIREMVDGDEQSPLAAAAKVFKEKGPVELAKRFPLEAKILAEEVKAAQRRVQQFLLLKNDAVEYNHEKPDQDQSYVLRFIEDEGALFAKNGGKYLTQNGRQFMPRTAFIAMLGTNPAENATLDRQKWQTRSFWTFNDNQIVDLLAVHAKKMAEFRVQQSIDEAKALGFERQPQTGLDVPPTTPAKPPEEIVTTGAAPSAAPGIAEPPKPPTNPASTSADDVLNTTYKHHFKKKAA